MALKLSNRASSLLSTNIGTDTTAIAITSGDEGAFPTLGVDDWCPLVVIDPAGNYEVMRCTARSGVNLTVERAKESTSAIAFNAGARVDVRLTAGALTEQTESATRLTTGTLPDGRLPDRLKAMADVATNADEIAATGFYQVASDALNTPVAAAGYITQVNIDADTAVQEFQAAAGLLRYVRQMAAGSWGSWTQTFLPPVATTIASATTTDLATATGENVIVSGSVTIVAFGNVNAGLRRYITYTGAPLMTHHATNMILLGGANIQVEAGDQAGYESLGTGKWRMFSYARAAAGPDGRLATDTRLGAVEKATPGEVAASTAGKYIDGALLKTASARGVLADAATVAVDWSAGINFEVEITANRGLGNPTAAEPDQYRTVLVKGSSSTQRTLTFGNQFKGDIPEITDITSTKWYLLTIRSITATHFVVSALVALKP